MSIERFKPSAADLKNAEEMMTDEQKVLSEEREEGINRTANRIASLGSQLLEEWRKHQYRKDSNGYKPIIKETKDEIWSQAHGGVTEVDVANTPYEDMPSDWLKGEKVSAEVAVHEVEKAMEAGISLDGNFIEAASSIQHEKWLERNGRWAFREQKKPYTELSEEEKEKNRAIVRKAVEVCREETVNIEEKEFGLVQEKEQNRKDTHIALESLKRQFNTIKSTIKHNFDTKATQYRRLKLTLDDYEVVVKNTIRKEYARLVELRAKLGGTEKPEMSNSIRLHMQELRNIDNLRRDVEIEVREDKRKGVESQEREKRLKRYAQEVGGAVISFARELTSREGENMRSLVDEHMLSGIRAGGRDFLDFGDSRNSADMNQLEDALSKVCTGLEGVGQVRNMRGMRESDESLARLNFALDNMQEAAKNMKKYINQDRGETSHRINRLINTNDNAHLYIRKARVALSKYMN